MTQLSADRSTIHADGQDLSFIQVEVLDKQGRLQPNADALISFNLTGPGTIAGLGNAWLKSTEPFQGTTCHVHHGRALVVLRGSKTTGTLNVKADGPCLASFFYPEKTGINYITVRGLTLCNAATNWAPPSAEQVGLMGPHWARGWVIDNNTIINSRCSGISLGRPTYGHAHHYQTLHTRVYPEPGSGQTDEQLAYFFEHASWDKGAAGHHIVRNNSISFCGQAGIVGCSGGAFSLIEGNDIHDIDCKESFHGWEQGCIKLHFAVDTVIRNNHLYRCADSRGLWLDWGAQGTQVIGNLCHDNR